MTETESHFFLLNVCLTSIVMRLKPHVSVDQGKNSCHWRLKVFRFLFLFKSFRNIITIKKAAFVKARAVALLNDEATRERVGAAAVFGKAVYIGRTRMEDKVPVCTSY